MLIQCCNPSFEEHESNFRFFERKYFINRLKLFALRFRHRKSLTRDDGWSKEKPPTVSGAGPGARMMNLSGPRKG